MVPKSYAELRGELAETRANRLQHWLEDSKDAFVKKTYLTNRAKWAHDGGDGETKGLKSKESGGFVTTNFDFDHPDLSTPANYINGEGIGDAGQFTSQGVNE